MRPTQAESSLDNRGRATRQQITGVIAAALITVGAMAVLNEPAEQVQPGADLAASNVAAAAQATPSQNDANVEASRPRFERTDEPAVEDSTNTHGG
jgi:hypothetical protein